MKKKLILLFLVFNCLIFAENWEIMTENYPPYNFINESKELSGVSAEVVQKLLDNMDIETEIKVYPWSRAYHILENHDRKVLFSMSRTVDRENSFKWVGPIIEYDVVFFAKKGKDITIDSLDDAKKVKSIGLAKNTPGEVFLKKNGFDNLDITANADLNPKKLMKGRIDLWLSGHLSGIHRAKQHGIAPEMLVPVYTIRTEQLYLAFSKTTPDQVIEKWQKELDKVKQSDFYQKAKEKYLK